MSESLQSSPGKVVMPFEPERCPFTAAWRVLGGKWKGVLWWRLSLGIGRFGELSRSIPQISKKVLAQALREFERDGIVVRREIPGTLPLVEYALTDYGRTLAPVVQALSSWGQAHLERGSQRRSR